MQHIWRRSAYRVSVRKPGWKRPLRRPQYRWKDNIKIGLKEIGLEGVAWILLAQDRDKWGAVVNIVKNPQVSQDVQNFSPG
jgi:hypothetical protein